MPAIIAFDTLSYANELKEAGFTEKQAEIQAKTLKKIIESNLATKQDILMLQKEIEKNAQAAKQDILMLQKDIATTKTDLQKEIANTKAGIIKWVAGMLLAQAAIVATLVKLL